MRTASHPHYMAFIFPLHRAKFSTKFRTQLFHFKLSYSTSLFPSHLTQVFSRQPTLASPAAVVKPNRKLKNAKFHDPMPPKIKKARTIARLVNTVPWSARLKSSLSTINPISQTTFLQTLRLIKTPIKALHFFNWAQESGCIHSHHSYFLMLEILGRARNLNPARNFLFSIPKKSNYVVPLTDKYFNSLIRSYGDAGLFQESIKVFKLMKSMGISPSAVTFNSCS